MADFIRDSYWFNLMWTFFFLFFFIFINMQITIPVHVQKPKDTFPSNVKNEELVRLMIQSLIDLGYK